VIPKLSFGFGALREGLQKLGWVEGRNLRVEYRWEGGPRSEPVRTRPGSVGAVRD